MNGDVSIPPPKTMGEATAMSASYRATRPDRSGVVCGGSPDVIRDFLRHDDAGWPLGDYEIIRVEVPSGCPPRRWGVAVKHADGSVELLVDGG
jgi:hypothetical protein